MEINKKEKKIGIITYHAAYNFGSVLQAYATQQMIGKIADFVEIINYRMPEQKNFYKLYRMKYGWKTLVKDFMQIPVHQLRLLRVKAFETFLSDYMNLTEEFALPLDVKKNWGKYDIIISGSDQIWNKRSQELARNSLDFMKPYLLDGFDGRKISYASSIANMADWELKPMLSLIKQFDSISMRETESAKHMSRLLGQTVLTVLDPTFLLTKEEWIAQLNLKKNNVEKFILYYSLGGTNQLKTVVPAVKEIAKRKLCKVKVVTPFVYQNIDDDIVEMHPEFGPIEFLSAVYNAETVITDSYHGTILSVNFNKNVYSLCGKAGSDIRKTDILSRLGMQDRIVVNAECLSTKSFKNIDYNQVVDRVRCLREESIEYLENALK